MHAKGEFDRLVGQFCWSGEEMWNSKKLAANEDSLKSAEYKFTKEEPYTKPLNWLERVVYQPAKTGTEPAGLPQQRRGVL